MSDQETPKLSSIEDSSRNYENPSSPQIAALYLDTETADVHFLLGDEQQPERIPAHKSILSVGSDVLKAMFYGELKKEGDVRIVDASAAAFKEFLQYFYLDSIETTKSNVSDVVNLGKKYNVVGCLRICEKRLRADLSHRNVCSSYELAILFDLKQLKRYCEMLISAQTQDVLKSSDFVNCSRNVLGHILKLDRFSCSEADVFHGCIAWLKAAAKTDQVTKEVVHNHLGDLFSEIRFGAMSIEEFSAWLPSYHHLFLANELSEIIQMTVSKDFRSENFKQRPRHVPWNENCIIECIRGIANDSVEMWYPLRSVEGTSFSVNQAVLLDGFTHAEVPSKYYDYISGRVTVSQGERFQIIHNQDVDYLSEEERFVRFLYPVLIKPGSIYLIWFEQASYDHDHRYKSHRLIAEVKLDSGLDVQFHDGTPKRFITGLKLSRVPHNFGSDV